MSIEDVVGMCALLSRPGLAPGAVTGVKVIPTFSLGDEDGMSGGHGIRTRSTSRRFVGAGTGGGGGAASSLPGSPDPRRTHTAPDVRAPPPSPNSPAAPSLPSP